MTILSTQCWVIFDHLKFYLSYGMKCISYSYIDCSVAADMVVKSLKLFIPILSLIYLHVYGNVLFEGKDIPKADWLASVNRTIVVRSPVECAIRCNKMYEANMSCNSITFDNSDNICTLGWYQKSPSREFG